MAAKGTDRYYVGIDVGGTKILAGLFDRSLRLLAKQKIQTTARRGPEAVEVALFEVPEEEAGDEATEAPAVRSGTQA